MFPWKGRLAGETGTQLATDDLGLYATEDRLHVHDIHATIMQLLGVDHTRLVYQHKGRPERVDLNEGRATKKVLGS